jgi:cytochrome d ubiquinol oxidase subunit II
MALQWIWFFLWGLLWAIFFITGGFDLGVGVLFPFLGKNDTQRRIILQSIGPVWDGNEVWLITAGGVTFAAFPKVYAVMFSTLYTPLLVILFALIFRGVAIEFRNQMENSKWRGFWDLMVFLGSLVPAVFFGIVFANIFQGIPFDGEGVYRGGFFTLLSPYALMGGALFLLLFLVHGVLWIAWKTEEDLQRRAAHTANILWVLLLICAVFFLIASGVATNLYDNYLQNPILFIFILANVAALIGVRFYAAKGQFAKAWFASAATILLCTFYGVIGLFPKLLPSTVDPAYHLTAFNASSTALTLTIMLVVALIFIPIVIAYQTWAYRVFHGPVKEEHLSEGLY